MVVYKVTNKINGMLYVGMTRRKLEQRLVEHSKANTPLGEAIRNLGIENFAIEVIEECQTQEQASQKERFYVKEFECRVPNGYNQTDGGEPGHPKADKIVSICSQDAEKSALDLLVEENKLTSDDKIFIETFLRATSCSRAFLRNIWFQISKNGECEPSASIIVSLAKFFNVSSDYLLGLSDEPQLPDEKTMAFIRSLQAYWNGG
ncbi:MAG: GIY-YIG nuclease family protein [Selenomonadaceae bacterium]|nr:GIY-YIG nuclease family protein [Selenomonadaceae bacterium]